MAQLLNNKKIDYRVATSDQIGDLLNQFDNLISKGELDLDTSSPYLKTIARNANATSDQKNRIYSLSKSELSADFLKKITVDLLNSDPNPEVDFFEKFLKSKKGSIWQVWSMFEGSRFYSSFDAAFVNTIDKIALSSKEKVPYVVVSRVDTFTEWFEDNNEHGDKMSKETAAKYLLHFIEYGDEDIIIDIKSDYYVGAEWLEMSGIKEAMYKLTNDIKYVQGPVRNFFYFPE